MAVLYGVVSIIILLFGISIGIFIPMIIKKYIEQCLMDLKKEKNNEVKSINPTESLSNEIIDEWQNGGVDNE